LSCSEKNGMEHSFSVHHHELTERLPAKRRN
jgi:hypothetical protein